MPKEWIATCKDCGKSFGYSDASLQTAIARGQSRPERCPACRRHHSREIGMVGISHFVLKPVRPVSDSGLSPGELGSLERDYWRDQIHKAREEAGSVGPDDFVIKDEGIREFLDLLQRHQVMVVVAPTGAGKSTFLPYRLMVPPSDMPQDLFTRHGQIIVTQPRIQATVRIPSRVAKELHGSSLGAGFDVGFRYSKEKHSTDHRNKLVYMTDGSLINMIVGNQLSTLSVIMIDEAHERSLNIDLILGLLKAQLRRYPQLRLIIASATIDTQQFLRYFGGPDTCDPEQYKTHGEEGDVDVYDNAAIARELAGTPVGFYGFPGARPYPVQIRFRTEAAIPITQMPRRMPEEVAKKVVQILGAMEGTESSDPQAALFDGPLPQGDILAFLHGADPIRDCVSSIQNKVDANPQLAGRVDVFPLYADLPEAQQESALKPSPDRDRKRVIVATNIAETSLTVEGIAHVVDSGLINEAQWDLERQTTYLIPAAHSKDGCKQRWGRAGRVKPGIAHCLYTEEQFRAFTDHTKPEILREPLEQIVLAAKAAGISDVKAFDWIEPPEGAELDRAPRFLQQVGALDSDGDLTEHGLELRSFHEDPPIANLMILADRFGCAVEMATLLPLRELGGYSCLLLWNRSWDADSKWGVHRIHHGLFAACQDDIEVGLKLWAAWEGAGTAGVQKRSEASKEAWAKRFFVDAAAVRQIESKRQDLLRGLSVRTRVDKIRPINFQLMTRLRIVLMYGLSNQLYELANRPELGGKLAETPVYQPIITRSTTSRSELERLYQDAVVEISPDSICAGRVLDTFVCGARQRRMKRVSPLKDPSPVITAAFVALVKREWLRCIGASHVALARLIAEETRDSEGGLITTSVQARLFLDQTYPIGATIECRIDAAGSDVHLGPTIADPPPLLVRMAYHDFEQPQVADALPTEPPADASTDIAGDETRGPQAEEGPENAPGTSQAAVSLDLYRGRLMNSMARVSRVLPFEATVVGYDWSESQSPVLLKVRSTPTPFDMFASRYEEGSDIQAQVVSIETCEKDELELLIVYERNTHLELVLDPYDLSLAGRNFALRALVPGTWFAATVEKIDRKARRVRVTRLKAAHAAMAEFLGGKTDRVVDAKIEEARDEGMYLWLDPQHAPDAPPCVAFVPTERLPQRPDEMSFGQMCSVKVRRLRWSKPLRRLVDLPTEAEKSRLGDNWDPDRQALVAQQPMTYHRRMVLLKCSPDPAFRRAVNWLFRRSNNLDVRVIDMTGINRLLPHRGQATSLPGRVVEVKEDAVIVALDDEMKVSIPRREVTYYQDTRLSDLHSVGAKVSVHVKDFNPDAGDDPKLSMLDPSADPLRAYHRYMTDDGATVDGTVIATLPQGARVELEPGMYGWLPIWELAWWWVNQVIDEVHEGQRIRVKIKAIDDEKREITLTKKLDENDPLRRYVVDGVYTGTVTRFTSNGDAIVRFQPGAEGFLNKNELRSYPVNDARDILRENEQVTVRVTWKDDIKRNLSLTLHRRCVARFRLDNRQRGLLLLEGPDGKAVQRIEQATGARVNTRGADGLARVEAPDDATLNRTLRMIEETVRYYQTRLRVQLTPSEIRANIIGYGGGEIIKSIVQESGVRYVHGEKDAQKRFTGGFEIEGPTRNEVDKAVELLRRRLPQQRVPGRLGLFERTVDTDLRILGSSQSPPFTYQR